MMILSIQLDGKASYSLVEGFQNTLSYRAQTVSLFDHDKGTKGS